MEVHVGDQVNFMNNLMILFTDKFQRIDELHTRHRDQFTAAFSWLPEERH